MKRRWFLAAAVLLAVLAAMVLLRGCGAPLVALVRYRLFPDYPVDRDGELDLPGLSRPVEVYLDGAGVPHIRAENERDLLRAVGFMHGRNRFFGMDVLRRVSRGRLSALVGEQPFLEGSTVELDRTMRGWGFDERVRLEAEQLPAELRELLAAYAAGVNAAVARYRPLEYRLLDCAPEPWTPADTLAVGLLAAWSVSHNWQQELSRLLLAMRGGIARALRIYPPDPWAGPTSIGQGPTAGAELPLPDHASELEPLFPLEPSANAATAGERSAAATRAEDSRTAALGSRSLLSAWLSAWRSGRGEGGTGGARPRGGPAVAGAGLNTWFAPGWGSNGWVVSGERSVSGKPLLANDPHLSHLAPSIAFQQHLACPGLDVIGMTIPGLPWVLSGHNREVAWGVTAAVADVIDLFVERTSAERPGEFLGPEGWAPLRQETVVVDVRGAEGLSQRGFVIRRSIHGPLLNDLYPELFPEGAPLVAVRWDLAGMGETLAAMREANRAGDVFALAETMWRSSVPVQTIQAADRQGNIGIFAAGRVPRRRHRGVFPAPGWLAAYDWSGVLAPEELPQSFNPPRGFTAHANNLYRDPAGPEPLFQIDSAPSYRLERITALLQERRRHDSESFARIQGDQVLLRARRLLPAILGDLQGAAPPGSLAGRAVALLAGWDGDARPGSAAAAVFHTLYRQAYILALRDEAPGAAAERFILSQRYATNAVDTWFLDPEHPVWDDLRTPGREGRAEVLRAALERAVADLRARLGDDPAAWRWGKLHGLQPRHTMGKRRALASLFNMPFREGGGGSASVWKTHMDLGDPAEPFRITAGPVYRMIVDLGDITRGRWIIDTGSSGWPSSPHYSDQYALWSELRYLPMISDWEEIRRTAQARLVLR
jgi:penicillin amidase